jgi:hypothetical protein
MRKLILGALLSLLFSGLYAQKLDDVKEKLQKQKFDEAKEKIDKVMADPKNQSNSEAWFYKAQTYMGLANTHPDDPAMKAQALDAMANYFRLEEKVEEKKRNLMSTFEGNRTAYGIYSAYFKAGADAYGKKDYQSALNNFEKSLESFELLKKYNLTTSAADTSGILYAGVSAESMRDSVKATKYYSRLADMKLDDSTYTGVYRYVIQYYLDVKDEANAKKYITLGEQVFPDHNPTWFYYELKLAGDDKPKQFAKYEELIQRYPDNHDLLLDYAVQYFNYTYVYQDRPADYAARQEKLRQVLPKVLTVMPDNFLVI